MNSLSLLLILSAALPTQRPTRADSNGQPVLTDCRVALIEEAQVPGREAGVLTEMNVREGQHVKAGELLGQVDDTKPLTLRKIKEKEYQVAVEQASNDVHVRFADKAAAVALKDYQLAVKANELQQGAIAGIEVDKRRLDAQKAQLSIEQAQFEMKVNKLTSEVKQAEVEAAQADIELRHITSPLDGVVVHVYKHRGEWVPPGDPVVHIVRVDRLRIEGFVSAAEYSPSEIANRPVKVSAKLSRGRTVEFDGQIVYVSPQDQPGGDFLVWAEVENREENGHWLLRPGTTATMAIQLR
jgi:macrolide-specific efflux system membrane fusion protein